MSVPTRGFTCKAIPMLQHGVGACKGATVLKFSLAWLTNRINPIRDELIIFQKCEELTQKVKNLEEVLESVTAERDMLVTMLQNANMQRDRAITQANMWRDEYQAPVAEEEKQSVAGHKRSFISENHLSIIICNFGALVS
ncbi:hypothetical protein BC832DRAFT_474053 [Gaertneriomyces semiglobifer]|nr:hypothetical protein BC832DRAFT_474053 [Gaertneriomyces semiglobifer]